MTTNRVKPNTSRLEYKDYAGKDATSVVHIDGSRISDQVGGWSEGSPIRTRWTHRFGEKNIREAPNSIGQRRYPHRGGRGWELTFQRTPWPFQGALEGWSRRQVAPGSAYGCLFRLLGIRPALESPFRHTIKIRELLRKALNNAMLRAWKYVRFSDRYQTMRNTRELSGRACLVSHRPWI